MADNSEITDLLEFWFGEIPSRSYGLKELFKTLPKYPYWYGKAFSFLKVDEKIAIRYRLLVRRARSGELNDWKLTRNGRLALILLLDQLPRNMHRDTAQAFESDIQAYELAAYAIKKGDDKYVNALARTYYYFPFMHQEDIDIQNKSVVLYKNNMREAGILNVCTVIGAYISSLRHREIIERFGRYPHRNRILGRAETKEEAEFLKRPFSSF